MNKIGEFEFIGGYKISTLLASSHACELYEARDTSLENALPVILVFWPELELTSDEEINVYQQKAHPGNSILSGTSFVTILNSGLHDKHPYIVVPDSLEILSSLRSHVLLIDKVLQEVQHLHPDDQHMLASTFLDIFMGRPVEVEQTTPISPDEPYLAPIPFEQTSSDSISSDETQVVGSSPALVEASLPFKSRQRSINWYTVALLILLLILLIWGAGALYAIIPASSATITITPTKKEFSQGYNFNIVARKSNASYEVQGREISVTSAQFSQTVPATGNGHHDATQAKGAVLISQIQFDNPKNSKLITATIVAADGLSVTTEEAVTAPQGGKITIPAHITQPGSVGNIPADDIDEPIELINTKTKLQDGTAYLSNPAPFTGGTDARDFIFVQQSDLDHVTKPFIAKVTSATRQKVMGQIQTGEHLAKDMQCTPNIVSNHHVLSEANDVSIRVSLICRALVYSEQTIRNAAMTNYQHDGVAQFGAGYAVVGDMVPGTIAASNLYPSGDPQFSLTVAGIWSFQYTQTRKQDITRLLAGKPKDAASKLLHTRKDIQDINISTSGIPGSALPSSPSNITIIITKISGLHV